MGFCDICDQPYPLAMLCGGICARCYHAHAEYDLEPGTLAHGWALAQARIAEGPRQLPPAVMGIPSKKEMARLLQNPSPAMRAVLDKMRGAGQ